MLSTVSPTHSCPDRRGREGGVRVTVSPRFLVIIPAYNEEADLGNTISSICKEAPWADIVVVDDGSKDATADIARDEGVVLLRLPYNLGIGGAVQTGYIYAFENGYDVAVQVDGDGQHDPAYIPVLVAPLEMGIADLVVGSRFIGPCMFRSGWARLAGIHWFARLVSLLIGQKVTDTTSGFRAANRALIAFFAHTYPQDYPEPETLIIAHRAGFRIQEVPVEMHARKGGQSSISPWRSAYYMIKVTIAIAMSFFRPLAFQRREI
jgi:glycosyltransferase involved in cell wall biosynthesis